MWPKGKILFLVPRGSSGWQGVISLLHALHRNVLMRETGPDEPVDLADLLPAVEAGITDGGATEILYWPGVDEEDPYRQWGLTRGILQTEVSQFLQRYWEEEVILPSSVVSKEGEPVLWQILHNAGFEPSLLWEKENGEWEVQIGNGIHWIVPETWLKEYWQGSTFGRLPYLYYPESFWSIHGDLVEYYRDQKGYEYLGSIKAYQDRDLEEGIYSVVLQALQLGVPWRNIRRTYEALLEIDHTGPQENIRWYTDEFTRAEWAVGT